MNERIASEILLYAIKNGISMIKLDDSEVSHPMNYCKVKRMGRDDNEVQKAVLMYKEMYTDKLKLQSELKVRYQIIE